MKCPLHVSAFVCVFAAVAIFPAGGLQSPVTSDAIHIDEVLEELWLSLRQTSAKLLRASADGNILGQLSTEAIAPKAHESEFVDSGKSSAIFDESGNVVPHVMPRADFTSPEAQATTIEQPGSTPEGDFCLQTCKWWEHCVMVEICEAGACKVQSKCMIQTWFAAIGLLFVICPAMCRLFHLLAFSALFGRIPIPRWMSPMSGDVGDQIPGRAASAMLADQVVAKFATPPADVQVIDATTTVVAYGEEQAGKMAKQKDTPCTICLNDFHSSARVRILPCAHMFHVACIDGWLAQSGACPMCKHEIAGQPCSQKLDKMA